MNRLQFIAYCSKVMRFATDDDTQLNDCEGGCRQKDSTIRKAQERTGRKMRIIVKCSHLLGKPHKCFLSHYVSYHIVQFYVMGIQLLYAALMLPVYCRPIPKVSVLILLFTITQLLLSYLIKETCSATVSKSCRKLWQI